MVEHDTEAIWRLLHFSLYGIIPTVYWLHLHLKGQHYVCFNADTEGGLDHAVQQGGNQILHLMDSCHSWRWAVSHVTPVTVA